MNRTAFCNLIPGSTMRMQGTAKGEPCAGPDAFPSAVELDWRPSVEECVDRVEYSPRTKEQPCGLFCAVLEQVWHAVFCEPCQQPLLEKDPRLKVVAAVSRPPEAAAEAH